MRERKREREREGKRERKREWVSDTKKAKDNNFREKSKQEFINLTLKSYLTA